MRLGWVWVAATTMLAMPCAAEEYSYTSFLTLPGAPQSQSIFVGGINNDGDVVGYGSALANGYGFLYSKGQFTAVSVPGAAVGTFPHGINTSGRIVGYADFGNSIAGFTAHDGVYAALTLPGGGQLLATGINARGHVIGFSYAGGSSPSSFGVFAGGHVQTLAVPGATSTTPLGIDDADEIVGTYTDAAGSHGFLFAYGLYARFDVPGSEPGTTSATGLNNRGEIVGGFADRHGTHGFVERYGHFKTLTFPGTTYGTTASGINDEGVIAGSYVIANPNSPQSTSTGFIATPVWATAPAAP